MEAPAINIRDLNFQYAENSGVVLKDFNFNVALGERFGLFGPNGAGKTTLMNLMTGVLQPVSGTIEVLGKNITTEENLVKKLFGFVPQHHSLYPELSPAENLEFFGAWAGLNRSETNERTKELLNVLGLSHVADKSVSKFSGGMKSRVNLAIGVIHRPKILFLDEPTTGVDVQSRHAIIQYLKELNAAGTTLIYTSHHLSEAESLCTQVALIDEGKIVAKNDLPTLLKEHQQDGLEGLFLSLTGHSYRDS
ncbi:MAG TPA: ABC transporter ATP-binding protein [Chitinophagales bacterium]|nr:ABC transporter ATP-binding protein [Chitinophagales bacterium]